MTITQTVEVPDDRLITLKVPRGIPAGPVILTFTPAPKETTAPANACPVLTAPLPVPDTLPGGNFSTAEEAMEAAAKDAADPNRKPISELFGTLPNHTFGDPVAYQRAIRDEWDD